MLNPAQEPVGLPEVLGVSDRIRYIGLVPDEDMAALYVRILSCPSL